MALTFPNKFETIHLTFLLISSIFCTTIAVDPPSNFPPSIKLDLLPFDTWGHDQYLPSVWTVTPKNAQEILAVSNWARKSGYKIRPSGFEHTWSPLTVSKLDTTGDDPPRVILLKMAPNLNKMQVISNSLGDSSFWAEPGVTMEDLTEYLEQNNLAFSHIPATGQITLGGVLAIDGHGAAVEAKNGSPPVVKEKGQSYGTLSNLVMSFTAVVYDENNDEYILRNFDRSDPMAKYFLVNLGRTMLTNVTMRIGPLFLVECSSDFNIPASDLFRPPPRNGPLPNPEPLRSRFGQMLEFSGRFETIVFPYSDFAWSKTWYVREKSGMSGGERKGPYNYPFSDNWPHSVTETVDRIKKGEYGRAAYLGNQMYQAAIQNMSITQGPVTIWGTARSMLLYIRATTLRVTANGYAILLKRENVQDFVSKFYTNYLALGALYEAQGKFPFNGPLELRASGMENPEDVGISGAEAPCLSATRRINEKSDFDTVIWLNVLSLARTPYLFEAMDKVEQMLVKMMKESRGQFVLRPEWSKGWAYTEDGVWKDAEFIREFVWKNGSQVDPNGSCWDETVRVLNRMDPFRIFSNAFLDDVMRM